MTRRAGGKSDHEHRPPRAGDRCRFPRASQNDAGDGGDHVADGREGLKPAQGERPGTVRHDLGDKRHAHGELAAHAQSGQEPIEREIPDPDGDALKPVKAE